MARTKTNTENNTKTCRTPRRNRHSEKHTISLRFSDFKTRYPVCNMMVTYNAIVCRYVQTSLWQKGDIRLDVLINKTGRDISI